MLAGGLFVGLMGVLWREVAREPTRNAVALLIVFSSAFVQLFFGYVENYTLVATAIAAYVLLAWLFLEGRCGLFCLAGLGTSFACTSGGWLFPSLAFLWLTRCRAASRAQNVRRAAAVALGVLGPIVLTLGYCTWLGVEPAAIRKSHLWQMKFLFRIPPTYRHYHYPTLSWAHLIDALNEAVLTAVPGIMALGWVGLSPGARPERRDRMLGFLILIAAFLQIFSFTWASEIGAYPDWDLFGFIGLGYGLLGAYLVVRSVKELERLRYGGLAIAALGLTLTGIWVVGNHRRAVPVDAGHAAVHVQLAYAAAKAGDVEVAIRNYEEAIRIDPSFAEARLSLGALYWDTGRRDLARTHLERYLELEPDGKAAPEVRKLLGR